MSTVEFQTLLDAGYSEAFLRTPFGSPTELRRQYLNDETKPHTCKHCGKFFQLPRKQSRAALNANHEDLRFKYSATVLEKGYCNRKCESAANTPSTSDLFGD